MIGLGRITERFRIFLGKNAFASSVCRMTPAAEPKRRKAGILVFALSYSRAGTARTETTTGIPSPRAVKRAMLLQVFKKERMTSGLSASQMSRRVLQRVLKLAARFPRSSSSFGSE